MSMFKEAISDFINFYFDSTKAKDIKVSINNDNNICTIKCNTNDSYITLCNTINYIKEQIGNTILIFKLDIINKQCIITQKPDTENSQYCYIFDYDNIRFMKVFIKHPSENAYDDIDKICKKFGLNEDEISYMFVDNEVILEEVEL